MHKSSKKIRLIIVVLVSLCIILVAVLYISRPYSPSVTIQGIEQAINNELLVKSGEDYYKLQPTKDAYELFMLDKWQLTRNRPQETPTIKFRLAEEWIIEMYSSGKAEIYYGYASGKHKTSAFYNIPKEVVSNLVDYVSKNGEIQLIQMEQYLESEFLH